MDGADAEVAASGADAPASGEEGASADVAAASTSASGAPAVTALCELHAASRAAMPKVEMRFMVLPAGLRSNRSTQAVVPQDGLSAGCDAPSETQREGG